MWLQFESHAGSESRVAEGTGKTRGLPSLPHQSVHPKFPAPSKSTLLGSQNLWAQDAAVTTEGNDGEEDPLVVSPDSVSAPPPANRSTTPIKAVTPASAC